MRKKFRFLTVLAVCVMVLSCFSVTAFAYADDTEQNLPVTEATQPEQQPETTPAPEKPKGEPIDDEGNAYTRDLLYYDSLSTLKTSVQNPSAGDAYGVGIGEPYEEAPFTIHFTTSNLNENSISSDKSGAQIESAFNAGLRVEAFLDGKNLNLENAKSIIAEASGVPVNTTFGSITKPIDLLLEVIDMSADLIALIREETELKKHHRAYLHVHEELEDCADEMAARMQEIFDETTDCVIGLMKDVHETFRVRKQEAAEDDADTVTIAKEDYETMIDDLLTMSEIIQCVADMRTQDVKAIREVAKFVPAFVSFEKNRLSLYREAAKEAEDIFNRWADEFDDLDEDYEPGEFFSD